MSTLVRSVLLGLCALAGPLAAAPVPLPAKYDPPTAIGQVASVQRLVDSVTGSMKAFSPDSADAFERGLADLLGEKGWAGADIKKPVGVFAYVKPKLEESYVVFVVPITKEKEAIDLLERLGAGLEEEAKGVYALHWRGVLPPGTTARLRFHDGHAYFGINAEADALDPGKLLPVSSLVDEKETAPVVVTVHPGRLPTALKEIMDGWWTSGKAGLDQLEGQAQRDMPKGFPAFAKSVVSWADASTAALFKDADTFTVRLNYEPKTVDATAVITVVPKVKSPLAADIEKLKPAPGRFHQLVTKDAVGGMWLRAGASFPKEVREKAGPFLGDWIGLMERSAGEEMQPLVAALAQAVNTMVVEGKTDAGAALLGADKNGAHTAVLAAAMPDPAALEKVVRKMVKDSPKELQELVKFDAEKAGEVAVHTFAVPEEGGVEGVFGKKTVVRAAFGKDAVYLAVGPDGLEQIKKAVALKPADAKQFDIQMNPAKVNKLIADMGGGGGMWLDIMVGKEEGLRSYSGVDVKGGKELTVTYTQHRLGLLFGMAFFAFRIG